MVMESKRRRGAERWATKVHPHADGLSSSDAGSSATGTDNEDELASEPASLFVINDAMRSSRDRSATDRLRTTLEATGYTELRVLNCEVMGGVAILRGDVSSFYLKQIAECCPQAPLDQWGSKSALSEAAVTSLKRNHDKVSDRIRIRQSEPMKETAMVKEMQSDAAARALRLGASAFVSKLAYGDELLRKLRDALQGRISFEGPVVKTLLRQQN